MKKKDAESINGTLEMLKRLAYSVRGVMDVVDYNNIKVAKQTMDKLAIGEIIKEACEE